MGKVICFKYYYLYHKDFFVFTIQICCANILIKVVFKLNLGERLKIARKSKGLTQDRLAKKIGTSRGVITNIELNKTDMPQPLIINALCNVLEITQEWLLNGTGEMNNSEEIRSSKVLSEIYSISQNLSEDEQYYILDVIKTYQKHLNQKRNE